MEPIIGEENTNGDNNEMITLSSQRCVIITGSSDGLGKVCAKMLANTNYCVILANRDLVKAKVVLDDIKLTSNNNNVHSLELDLSSFDSVKNFVNKFKSYNLKLDILINNAGIYAPPFSITKDGFESQFQVNHLGVFLLTNLLMECFSEHARIVNLSSMAHKNASNFDVNDLNCLDENKYHGLTRYSNSKFYTILFTKELNRIFKKNNSKIIAVCLHPGVIPTNLFKHLPKYAQMLISLAQPFITTLNQASKAIYRLAIGCDPELDSIKGGEYFNITVEQQPTAQSLNQTNWRLLWSKSCEYCKIDDIGK